MGPGRGREGGLSHPYKHASNLIGRDGVDRTVPEVREDVLPGTVDVGVPGGVLQVVGSVQEPSHVITKGRNASRPSILDFFLLNASAVARSPKNRCSLTLNPGIRHQRDSLPTVPPPTPCRTSEGSWWATVLPTCRPCSVRFRSIVAPLGLRVDESSPYVDARLPDGSRVNAIIPPLSLCGPTVTIRKFGLRPFAPTELVDMGAVPEDVLSLLSDRVRARANIIVSGGTGSGKTTLLGVLSSFIPRVERLITIEDVAELRLSQPHVVSLEARPANVDGVGEVTVRALVRNALRMRPDRIIVGEVRGGEAIDMLQAMNTGHEGSMSTAHANTSRDLLSRLETMALMSDLELPVSHVREQIASALDLILHTARMSDGSRALTSVTAVEGLRGGVIRTAEIYSLPRSRPTGRHVGLPDPDRPVPARPSAPRFAPTPVGRARVAWAGTARSLGTVLE